MQIAEIPQLDIRGLRQFAVTTGGIVALLFGVFFPWLLEASWPLWPWIVFSVLAVWGLVAPNSLKPVYRGWMRVGLLLGKITTPIIMTLIFCTAIIPGSILMRLTGKDPMRRKFDSMDTYRNKSSTPSVKNMDKPY